MRRIAVTVSVNILIWRVAIVEYSSMATFVNGVEHLVAAANFGPETSREDGNICYR